MKIARGRGRTASWIFGGLAPLAAVVLAGACGSQPSPSGSGSENPTTPRVFANGGFETGTAGAAPPAPWTVAKDLNPDPTGVTIQSPQTYAGLNLKANGGACGLLAGNCDGNEYGTCVNGTCSASAKTVVLNGTNQPDPTLGSAASLRWPRYGSQCALVNQLGSQSNANILSQTMTVAAGDVDPLDGKIHVRMVVAPVLEDPGHPANEQPYFFVQVSNLTRSTILYSNFNFSNQTGIPWQTVTTTGGNASTYKYTDWQLIDVAPGTPGINPGDSVQLQIIASGCSLGAHMGEVYVDGVGATIPGIYVSATGPAEANAGSNITYNLTYKNGSGAAETGVVINLTTPPSTTYQSIVPPAGATCTEPAVGSAGTITCTFAAGIPAAGTGTFSVTVAVAAGTTTPIVLGTYSIQSTQETPLLGNTVTTLIGCTADSQCSTGNWCDESTAQCTPTLANGTAVPNDPAHTNPTLNGTCTTAAGSLVCTSQVCDTVDNDCGYKNGDGPCTAATGVTVCRAGICDTDGKCGLANGDGPCTTGDGSTICRSGACSTDGTCEPAGGCNADTDCSTNDWCNETSHTCVAKLASGVPIPTDPAHTDPVLTGSCTTAAGTAVCTAGVCDTKNNDCGYANGDGPCTIFNGATVCQSGACALLGGVCVPAGGCFVDADCTGQQFCDTATFTCEPKLANGTAIPTINGHTPPLTGTCNATVGASVCSSGVCDTVTNKCGLGLGETCATSAQCQSGDCGTSLVCVTPGACVLDTDCTGSQFCEAPNCVPKIANGQPIPTFAGHLPALTGTCSAAVGLDVCVSTVCSTTDNECGLPNGQPCTVATENECRSGACSVSLTCEPTGGCNVDADCTAGNWCNESLHMCEAQLANGKPIPTDTAHTNPTLNGTCSVAAGALVCVTGVCGSNNECGLANGQACTVANEADCQSGDCSTTGLVCIPASGCSVDADCATADYCNTPTSTCVPKVANGSAVPTVTGHTPTLNGTCTTAAGLSACVSGVCDTKDNKCGYANGDGPCTVATESDCRSGDCSTNLTCVAAGGCNVDADCSSGLWCNETMHVCVAQLPNGTAIPTDSAHTNPTVNGTCTLAAGALVCVSGVCDTKDNKCGYANGDGPCTPLDGTQDCRSTICGTTGSTAGLCVGCLMDSQCSGGTPVCNTTTGSCVQCTSSSQCPTDAPQCDTTTGVCTTACMMDSDCPSVDWCDILTGTSGLCEPKIANGNPLPTMPSSVATCTTAVGARVCISGVCDTKTNDCGYALGEGPCTSNSQCDTGVCDPTSKTCVAGTPDGGTDGGHTDGGHVDGGHTDGGHVDGGHTDGGRADATSSEGGTRDAGADGGHGGKCANDSECGAGDYCDDGTCVSQIPLGQACATNTQCVSGDCVDGTCSDVVSSGNGLCAVRAVGSSSRDEDGNVFGIVLALGAVVWSRRRRTAA